MFTGFYFDFDLLLVNRLHNIISTLKIALTDSVVNLVMSYYITIKKGIEKVTNTHLAPGVATHY